MADVTSIFDAQQGCWTYECVECEWQIRVAEEPASAPFPAEPTDSQPGSAGKLEVLRQRAGRREQLFHPKDNQKPKPPPEAQEERRESEGALPHGVRFRRDSGLYEARTTKRKGRRTLGTFATAEEAGEAVRRAEEEEITGVEVTDVD